MGKSRYWVIGWFSGEQRDRPVIGKTESMRSSTDHTTARLNQRSGNACAICLGVPATGENFVDRAEQLEIMLSVTAAVIVGQAQNSVAFIGAAGMGKTSLLLEGARRIQAEYGKKTIPIAIFGREVGNEMHVLETVREGLCLPQKRFVQSAWISSVAHIISIISLVRFVLPGM